MEYKRFTRKGNRTICILTFSKGPGFIAWAEHEDPSEAERLAYEKALQKSRVVSIKQLAMYKQWKLSKRIR